MHLSPTIAALLFAPATLGLLVQGVQPSPWTHRLLAVALLLMSLEQAHMARVDLRNIALVEGRSPDPRLTPFRRVVVLAVLGQVVGFSLAALGHLGAGMGVILLGLVGFNLGASVRLNPDDSHPVQGANWRSRLDVLTLDAIALGLAILWMAGLAQPWVAGGMFAITLLYGGSKLWTYLAAARAAGNRPLAVHVAHAAQQHPQPAHQYDQGQPTHRRV